MQNISNWIPVIATLSGALIGGIISCIVTIITLTGAEKSEKRKIMMTKLEEAHQVARSIRQSYRETYAPMAAKLASGVDVSKKPSEPLEIDRLAMLVHFYFPELKSSITSLELAREKFGSVLTEGIMVDMKQTRPSKEIFDDLSQRYNELDKNCGQLLDQIALTAHRRFKI